VIVDQGAKWLLDVQTGNVADFLDNANFFLFTNDFDVEAGTLTGDLVPAAWAGYADQPAGPWTPAAVISGRAQVFPLANPVFHNGSAGPVQFYGWGLKAGVGLFLIAAINIGLQTIPAGRDYVLLPAITDRDDG
jgi:hypothetical protein